MGHILLGNLLFHEKLLEPNQFLCYRDTILKLLLDGARELGNTVCSHIRALLNELHTLRRRPEASTSALSAQAGTSSEETDSESVDRSKGFLMVKKI